MDKAARPWVTSSPEETEKLVSILTKLVQLLLILHTIRFLSLLE